jgi:RNA polymerase sigma-70 factor (ECF subfamily)
MANPDPRATYEQWVRQFAAELFRFAYRLTGNRQVTEDLVQETFTEAWKSMHTQREPHKARAWLFQILRFRYAHLLRDAKARLRPATLTDGMDIADSSPPPADLLAEREALQAALDELSPDIRETFLLVFMQGLKCREAAEELNVPLGTVLSRLNRARVAMRTRLRVDGSRDAAAESVSGDLQHHG